MFRSNFFISIRETDDRCWQPVMMTRYPIPNEDDPYVWATGWHHSSRGQAEREARKWAKYEGTCYKYVAPKEVAK